MLTGLAPRWGCPWRVGPHECVSAVRWLGRKSDDRRLDRLNSVRWVSNQRWNGGALDPVVEHLLAEMEAEDAYGGKIVWLASPPEL